MSSIKLENRRRKVHFSYVLSTIPPKDKFNSVRVHYMIPVLNPAVTTAKHPLKPKMHI